MRAQCGLALTGAIMLSVISFLAIIAEAISSSRPDARPLIVSEARIEVVQETQLSAVEAEVNRR